jgi:hypothetical protein
MKYQIEECESPVYAVVQTVAAYEDREVDSLPPMENTLNTDALNAICSDRSNTNLCVSFQYSDSYILIEENTVFVSSEKLSRPPRALFDSPSRA